ncbi:hypothetical protein BKA70DRAFT_1249058 [Coprinopsis sp. MPI-PUGE-AT-0042]|nr:hypothetical protein BKA70DRAFT_1249058 [Coprinopsis sp. MPI-PUGE-AT-0042]
MDVDVIHPLPFRPSATPMTRSTSGKRARSPDADAYFAGEHPSKRIFLRTFTGDGSRSPGGSSYGGGSGDVHSASSSRYSSEDWVAQAGVLSIDSPMHTSGASRSSASSSLENLHHSNPLDDVDMAMDTEEQTLQPTQNPSASSSSMSVSGDANSLAHHPAASTSCTSLHAGILNPHPQINIHPATPTPSLTSTRPSSRASIHRHPTPEPQPSESPMALSPAQSFTQLLTTPRRARFTMGPRADCEKCRLGVKGHWMHL